MQEKKFRVGLLGWGNAGRYFHAPLIQVDPGFDLVAVSTSRAEAQDQLPGVQVVSDPQALFSNPDLDLIVVTSPHRFHAEHARAALLAGKYVVVEKPLAQSVQEAQELNELANQMNGKLFVFQNRRWDSDFMTVRRVIESGALGEVYWFESHWSLYRPKKRGVWRESPEALGGVLYDLGPHMVDHALQLFGSPTSVYAQLKSHRDDSLVDDMFHLHLRYCSGLDVTLSCDMLAALPGPRFHVRGRRGTFEKHGHDPQEALLRSGQIPTADGWGTEPEADWGRLKTQDMSGLAIDGSVTSLPGDYRQFYRQIHARLKDETAGNDLKDVIMQLRILEAARRSAENNSVESLADD